ncbi:putative E3 ubiquitin-protein ligase UBR7, partial [Stegodyphus mimosarum]
MAESSNSSPKEDTELTMCDVLQEEQELEEDANAVLGGSDDTNCSYDKGYVSRQALYACTTCSVNDQPSGICLACCYACHDGHEVVELYTKRNFRCDCGNSKFPGKTCTLRPEKDPLNLKNKYNQNFRGLYCNCSRPYPDLEDDTPDEMIQCVMCEDWYHGRHLGCEIPDDYFEMICGKCMETHKFLYTYLNNFQNIKVCDDENTIKQENGVQEEKFKTAENKEAVLSIKEENDSQLSTKNQGINNASAVSFQSDSSNVKQEDNICNVKVECDTEKGAENCILKKMETDKIITSGTAFWPENWRTELCHCSSCMDIYLKYDCEYLLNPDDTIQAYEERGKGCATESQYDKGLSALSQMDRVKQMEAIRAYTSMKGQLKEYLKAFADNKRTVSENDIKEFFEGISKRKKLNNGVPYFCR